MRRLLLPSWVLFLVVVLMVACSDDDSPTDTPMPVEPIDLTAFQGCWHVRSIATVVGNSNTACGRAIDSVAALFEVAGAESLFAPIDTVTDLSFVQPYVGHGDYTGTVIPDRNGTVEATFRHPIATGCTLVTRMTGSITAQSDTGFFAPYSVHVQFDGCDTCHTQSAYVTFQGTRRPDARCP
jgi:hypothetical protein